MSTQLLNITNLQKTLNSAKSTFTLGTLSFDINQGEIIALVGLNGAGKTTLLKSIMGLITLNSGEIIFNNDISNFNRNKIGYFPETFSGVKTNLKVEYFLQIIAKLNNISDNNVDITIRDVLEKVNNWEHRKKHFNQLSKGMKTRIGIAQALLSDSSLLILDEPTDGLDPKGKREIKELLTKLKYENKTILFSSHNLQEVETICDRVIIIDNGKILINDTINNIQNKNNNLNSLENFFFNIINKDE